MKPHLHGQIKGQIINHTYLFMHAGLNGVN